MNYNEIRLVIINKSDKKNISPNDIFPSISNVFFRCTIPAQSRTTTAAIKHTKATTGMLSAIPIFGTLSYFTSSHEKFVPHKGTNKNRLFPIFITS